MADAVPRPRRKLARTWRSEARSAPEVLAVFGRLGRRVRALRLERELTQERAATLAHLDAKHLQTIEAGKTNTTVASLVGLARALGVRLNELFEGV